MATVTVTLAGRQAVCEGMCRLWGEQQCKQTVESSLGSLVNGDESNTTNRKLSIKLSGGSLLVS